jgi:hypothetical protein
LDALGHLEILQDGLHHLVVLLDFVVRVGFVDLVQDV